MKIKFNPNGNKLNSILIIFVLLAVGLGCDKLTGASLENTTWKGNMSDQTKQQFPASIEFMPEGRAIIGITLPNAAQPIIQNGTWKKDGKNVTVTWGSGNFVCNYNAMLDGNERMNGSFSNSLGNGTLDLSKQKK